MNFLIFLYMTTHIMYMSRNMKTFFPYGLSKYNGQNSLIYLATIRINA